MPAGKQLSASQQPPRGHQRGYGKQGTPQANGKHTLRLAIDYGTKTLAVTTLITSRDDKSPSNIPLDVFFDSAATPTPQKVAWSTAGTFYWGHDVQSALDHGEICTEDIIQLWKLLLYKEHKDSDMVKLVKKQLRERGKGLGELISVHLRDVIIKTKNVLKGATTQLNFTHEDIDALPVELFLSVPQMWKDPACSLMTRAAQIAGAEYVELVYEPECAAGTYTDIIKGRMPAQLVKTNTLLIADIGGGTGDFVTYEFCEDSSAGSQVKMRTVGEASGALCGSEFVSENFRQWLQHDALPGISFADHCEDLGITPVNALYQASTAFEDVKTKFTGQYTPGFKFIIEGEPTAPLQHWYVLITDREVRNCFDPVIKEILRLIDDALTSRTKALIVPGGFGRSDYLQRKLKDAYGHRGLSIMAGPNVAAPHTVSSGAFKRFTKIEPRGMKSTSSLGIGVVETYSAELHPDATYLRGEVMHNGKRCQIPAMMNHQIVEVDPHDEEYIVYERWRPILAKGTPRQPGQAFTTETWQLYVIEPGQTTITTQIYWTELDMKPSDPILTGRNALESKPRNGIEHWGSPITFTLPDLFEAGFESVSLFGKGGFYQIYVRIVLECNGANIQVHMQIAERDTQPFDELGHARPSDVELSAARIFTLCTDTFNPSVNSGVS